MKIFGIILGGIAALILLAVLALGAASELGYLPSPDTFSADEIPEKYIAQLKEVNIIEENEIVYYFYSAGFWSILEDGNLFTDRRAISYETYEDQLYVYSATYNEIEEIEMKKSDELWGTSEIEITKEDGSWFVLYADNEGDKDMLFFEGLNETWRGKPEPQ